MEKINEKYLKVRSIFLASYLASKDILPERIIPDIDGKMIFYFPITDKVLELENKFYTNKELQMFLNCYKVLKGKMLDK